MVKKGVKKKAVRKKAVRKTSKKTPAKSKASKAKSIRPKTVSAKSVAVDKGLAKNFVELQKVMTIQSMKIDKLTTQISGLLDLFSGAAKALAKKEFGPGNSEDISKLNDKIDDLFTQTQKMSKGIMNVSNEPEPMYSQSIDTTAPVSQVQVPTQVPVQVPQIQTPQVPQVPVQPQGNPMVAQDQVIQGSGKPATQEA